MVKLFEGPNAFPSSYVLRNWGLSIDYCARAHERSLYRWVKAYRAGGIEALENEPRQKIADSAVLPPELVEFIRVEKQRDTLASIPELLRRAQRKGIVAEDESISRVSVWRACRRMELPTARRKKAGDDKRRFSYPNRMLMVLADGKHFRAGVNRCKRVALNFLDDACRFGLNSIVGTSENAELFLRGLYQTILKYGLMSALYLDHGPGFISADTLQVVARLGIRLIHGTAAYPGRNMSTTLGHSRAAFSEPRLWWGDS